jgi:hypothetical protein
MAATTKIDVQAADNELILLASTARGSSVLCHLKSGFNAQVSYVFNPGHILPPGSYQLTAIGINWGGPGNFKIVVTTGGTPTTLQGSGSQVGVVWTQTIPMTTA